MNWKTKDRILAVLSRIPAGRGTYHRLQWLAGTNRLDIATEVRKALEIVELIHEGGKTIDGSRVVEIGTGWRPIVPFILSLGGAERVMTIDVNPWMTYAYAREAYRALSPQLDLIAEHLGLSAAIIQRRYRQAAVKSASLTELLRAFRIDYVCPGDAADTGLKNESTDLIVSSNVLEHIPPNILKGIHTESRRILKPGGLAVHRYNPGDHFAEVDESITTANFLRFSERQWRRLGGSGLAYHNRLRCSDYKALFADAGLGVQVHRRRVDADALAAIRTGRLPIHNDFKTYTIDDLAADYVWTVCSRAWSHRLVRCGISRWPRVACTKE